MKIETVIFHRKKGEPVENETFAGEFRRALTSAEKAMVRGMADSQGMTVRIAEIDMDTPPDFVRAVTA